MYVYRLLLANAFVHCRSTKFFFAYFSQSASFGRIIFLSFRSLKNVPKISIWWTSIGRSNVLHLKITQPMKKNLSLAWIWKWSPSLQWYYHIIVLRRKMEHLEKTNAPTDPSTFHAYIHLPSIFKAVAANAINPSPLSLWWMLQLQSTLIMVAILRLSYARRKLSYSAIHLSTWTRSLTTLSSKRAVNTEVTLNWIVEF